MRLLWLADVLRAAGLTVHEVPGWRERGNDDWGPVRGIVIHHTAGSRTSTVKGEINTLLHGSTSAPSPIAQLLLARDGSWHVVASGLCYHALIGWGGPNRGYGNGHLIGVEAQHSGGDEPWTPVQYGSYVAGVAALVARLGITPARVAGHKEHQPGAKSDPTFSMPQFRADVTGALTQEGDDMPTVDELLNADEIPNDINPGTPGSDGHNPEMSVKWALRYAARAELVRRDLAALRSEVRAALGQGPVDEQAIVDGILAGLSPDAIAAAIPEGVARAVVDALAARLAS